jgi:hypothetical protein
MGRLIAIPSLFFVLFLAGCTPPPPMTARDIVGVWRFDRSLSLPAESQTIPKSVDAFSIALHKDGTFVATDLPPVGFFLRLPDPDAKEQRGTWTMRYDAHDNAYYLTFQFTGAVLGTALEWKHQKLTIPIDRGEQHLPLYLTRSDG